VMARILQNQLAYASTLLR